MKTPADFEHIYLFSRAVDFRKSINGLSALVESKLEHDLFGASLFVFFCENRKKLKILYWDKTGFALWYKRLEKDRFPLPKNIEGKSFELTANQLEWILSGIDFWKLEPHKDLKFEKTS
jgi:transposase